MLLWFLACLTAEDILNPDGDAVEWPLDCKNADPDVPQTILECPTSKSSLEDARLRMTGASQGDHAGTFVAPAGDVNGDGYPDLLVGATGVELDGEFVGAVYLIFGRLNRWDNDHSLEEADVMMVGADGSARIGDSAISLGDVNGDGLDDLLVGSPTLISGYGHRAGGAFVMLGRTNWPSTWQLGTDVPILVGERAMDQAGSAFAAADINDDGVAEMIIAAPSHNDGSMTRGRVVVVQGGAALSAQGLTPLSAVGLSLLGGTDGDALGRSMASAGDVDGDGLYEIIVGAEFDDQGGISAGSAHLVWGDALPLGNVGAALNIKSVSSALIGPDFGDRAGRAVAGGGDMNGDGHADLVVGSGDSAGEPGPNSVIWVVYGEEQMSDVDLQSANLRLIAPSYGGLVSPTSLSLGDWNGDGFADLAVGLVNDEAGTVSLVLGASNLEGVLTRAEWSGESFGDDAGASTAFVEGLRGDGGTALLVGAPGWGAESGATYVLTEVAP